jgi:hypothetical protein
MASRQEPIWEESHLRAIQAVIARQFRSLNWTPQTSGDWKTFAADFFPSAVLYPAARPVRRQMPEEFVERMKGLAASKLRSFAEAALVATPRVSEMMSLRSRAGPTSATGKLCGRHGSFVLPEGI